MARMPGAIWQGEHGGRLMTRYDIVCVHTIVGYAPAHAAHFSVKGDGTILQSRDTRYKSGANLEGNHRVIAIENEDHGPHFPSWSGSDVPALTDAQVSANAQILRWAHETHGVPLELCPNSRPGSRGLAYHRQGCDGNFTDGWPGRVPGGETWTTSYGKVCPGANRISQRPDILQRAIGAPVLPEGFLMALSDQEQVYLYERLIRIEKALAKALGSSDEFLGYKDGVRGELRSLPDGPLVSSATVTGVDTALSNSRPSGSDARQGVRSLTGLGVGDVLGPRVAAIEAKLDAILAKFP